MKRLLRIEWIKTLNYPTFRTLLALYALLFLLVVIAASNISISIQGVNVQRLFQFPHVWGTIAWVAKWFNLLLGVLVVLLVTSEFQFRTFRKQLIDGLYRHELLLGKVIIVVLLALFAMMLVFVISLGFGTVKSSNISFVDFAEGITILPSIFLQTLAFLLLAMLFAFLFRNPALSIVSYILFFFPIEPIIRALLPGNSHRFMPIKVISNLTPMPDFFGITLGDMFLEQGGASPELFGVQPAPGALSVFLLMAITIGYSMLFVYISGCIVRRRNF